MKATIIVIISLLAATIVVAQDSSRHVSPKRIAPWFVERFRLTGGFFLPINNTNIQVGIKGGAAGTDIDFEKDLGFSKAQLTFLANFQWRISRRSRLNLNYYYIPRTANYTLKKDITFKDQIYHVNTTVNSVFNTSIYQFSYGYSIVAKSNFELGFLIGAHVVGGTTSISLTGTSGGISSKADFGFTAPLPDLGIWGGYAFSKRFAVNLELSYLSLTYGNISGRVASFNLAFMYSLMKHLELQLGFSGLDFKVDAVKENADGHFKWGYNGPSLGVTYSFGEKTWAH